MKQFMPHFQKKNWVYHIDKWIKIWFMSTTGMVKQISGLKFEANLGQLSSLSFPEKLIKIRINFFPRSFQAF